MGVIIANRIPERSQSETSIHEDELSKPRLSFSALEYYLVTERCSKSLLDFLENHQILFSVHPSSEYSLAIVELKPSFHVNPSQRIFQIVPIHIISFLKTSHSLIVENFSDNSRKFMGENKSLIK